MLIIEIDRYHFFETDTDIFKKFFTDICAVADIWLATDTDIKKICLPIFLPIF